MSPHLETPLLQRRWLSSSSSPDRSDVARNATKIMSSRSRNTRSGMQHNLLLKGSVCCGFLVAVVMYSLLCMRIIHTLDTEHGDGFFNTLRNNGPGCLGGGRSAGKTDKPKQEKSKYDKLSKHHLVTNFKQTFSKKDNLPSCSASINPKDISFTLVTQMDDNRMWVMKHHCEAWPHRISLALLTDRLEEDILNDLDEMGCQRSNIILSTLSSKKFLPSAYPVNVLRNLAIRSSSTTHFVNVDADFWLGKETYDALMMKEVREQLASDSKQALVIPAFQLHRQCPKGGDKELCKQEKIRLMPQTKDELQRAMATESVTMFDPKNPHGHDSTNYERWMHQATGQLEDIPCIKSERYEPYLVVRRCRELPPFQDEFTGYGWNKISWTIHLQQSGYKFAQLGGGFLVHFPHGDSKAKKKWTKESEEIKHTFREFVKWLSTKQDQERTPRCPSEAKFVTSTPEAPSCQRVPEDDMAFTVVSQLSDNRLWLMKHQCRQWKGPMSLAVFTNRTKASISGELDTMGCDIDNTAIAILDSQKYDAADYPVNILRNMAMSGIETSHFFYIDADFLLSENIEQTLMSDSVKDVLALSTHQALVIPAFQLHRECTKDGSKTNADKICTKPTVPISKSDLVEGIYRGDVTIFDYENNPGGHGSTRYNSWMGQGQDSVELIPCFASDRYEPYLVAQYCNELPPFQEDFTGYSSDKLSWIMHLHKAGYNFYQVGRAFVVHYPHKDDKWKQTKTLKSDVRQERFEQIMGSFKSWLMELPNDQHAPFCSDSQKKQLTVENAIARPLKQV